MRAKPWPCPCLLPQRELGSTLGYAALLVDTLCRLLQLPALHRCRYAGSHSVHWAPRGYWDTDPRPPPGAAMALRPPPLGGHPELGDGELLRSLRALQRSVGALAHAALRADAARLVAPGAGPFSWLAVTCCAVEAAPVAPSAGGGARPGPPPGAPGFLGQSTLHGPLGVGDADGWEVMPFPSHGRMIPPPPSQPDDVEHWARAMYGRPPGPRAHAHGGARASVAGAVRARVGRWYQQWAA